VYGFTAIEFTAHQMAHIEWEFASAGFDVYIAMLTSFNGPYINKFDTRNLIQSAIVALQLDSTVTQNAHLAQAAAQGASSTHIDHIRAAIYSALQLIEVMFDHMMIENTL
jgi:hypothetical protein